MTEPDVASSDATNISLRCGCGGDHYVLNGEKWWASGAGDPRCAIYIVMVKTGGEDKHRQHSMILVPSDTMGLTKIRLMLVYGDDDAPHGHFHIKFDNVRVQASNMILGEGKDSRLHRGGSGRGASTTACARLDKPRSVGDDVPQGHAP
jgi:acyl-CoA dehydrogenase